ncbi:LacI family DNA-binding transcriptional regulator [Actinoplanes subtropicus]|uniref:LacI family DNA-binding transcriptional regulator n=1 Tax=Actinoplanes subtropicus TaxID=543632 RepID=UPI00068D3569|nr:LacI family DNA-binding transcriptional regulator [Actinoplanes subtropicus]
MTRPTSSDVARLAGLSRSAVSQILGGNEDRFPPATRERVFAAAASLNYRPSKAGRALVTGVGDLVVLVVPNVTFGHHLQDGIDRITRGAAAHGLSVVVKYAGATVDAVLDLQPAAVIDLGVYSAAAAEALRAAGIRVLPARAFHDPNATIGALQAGELLRTPGRRLVYALLADDRLDPYGPPRAEGAARHARLAGVPDPIVVRVPLDRAGAVRALAPVLAESPVGIACYNDEVAIAALAAARELGLAVPGQVAVVGADHTSIGQLVTPRLTTVRIDFAALLDAVIPEAELRGIRSGHQEPPPSEADPSRFVTLVPGETS